MLYHLIIYKFLQRSFLGIVNFLKICEMTDETTALQILNAVSIGILSKQNIERLIYLNETKEHAEKRLFENLINQIK